MQKVMIIGTSGSGKTTLAYHLNKLYGIPAYDLDDYYWLPNWQPNPQELEKKLLTIFTEKTWIMSGNYSKFQEKILQEADTIIWLDYSLSRCLWQGLKRSLKRIFTKKSCCNGNYETIFRTFFSKHSLLIWILQTYSKRKINYQKVFQMPENCKTYHRFKNPSETRTWVKNCTHFASHSSSCG